MSLPTRRKLSFAAAAAVLGALAGLSGCFKPAEPEQPLGLAIVVGRHANAPAVPASDVQAIIPDRLPGGSRVVVIGVDGSNDGVPVLDKSIKVADDPSAEDPIAAEEAAANVRGKAKIKYEASRADAVESNPYAAIARAALGISQVPGEKKLVVVDSMISTAGLLELQEVGLDGAPEDVFESIANDKNLPTLTDIDVVVRGLGQTSAPQAPLDEAQRKTLESLTGYVLEQAGAKSVAFDYITYAEAPLPGAPRVTPVSVTPPKPAAPVRTAAPKACNPYVVSQTRIQFVQDSAEFIDPEQVRQVAGEVAKAMKDCPGQLRVTGTTSSWGTAKGRKAVSTMRAKAFRSVLADVMKVDASTIDVHGAGYDFKGRVKDRRSDGSLDPRKALENRTVRISVTKTA